MKSQSWRITGAALLASALLSPAAAQNCTTCQSFGTDFVDGGSFFQNSQSTANFTAYQEFTGCQPDYSDNILVDPNGNQYVCNTTPLTPSDTPELVTCPIQEDQMYSGNWTIVVISNNGDCDPIDYMREFYVSVGPQVTTTATPLTSTTATSTVTDTVITTQSASATITGSESLVVIPNTGVTVRTVTPSATTSITFVALYTVKVTTSVTSTAQATSTTCTTKTAKADVLNTKIRITALRKTPAATATAAATQNAVRAASPLIEEPVVSPVWETVIRRDAALGKRTPEAPTITVTASTRTTTVNTQTVTSTLTGTITSVSTLTLHPTVTVNGAASISTVTAPQPTVYNTIYNVFSITFVTTTKTAVITQTSTVTTAC